jgi:hypothetical protein
MCGIALHVGGNDVIGNNIFKIVEPEQGNLREHSSFVGNPSGQNIVESRNPVGCYEKKVIIVKAVNIPYFAAGVKL